MSRKPDRALADAEQALRLNPDLPVGHFVRGSANFNLGQYDAAIGDYTETLRLRPTSSDTLAQRGYTYHRKGDDARALADYNEVLKMEPDDVGTLLNRGDALRNLHEMSRAGADYGKAIRLAPENPGGWEGRGWIRLATQDFDGAIADFTEAIRIVPNKSTNYLNRGAALSLIKQNARALADEDLAIRLDPSHPLGYVNRGQTLNNLGDSVAALASVNKALEMAPGFPPALDVLKKIDDGGKKRGRRAVELSQDAAKRDWQICVFPVTDIGPPNAAMVEVINACTELINSNGGNDENRALVHLQRGSMYRRLGKFELALVDFSESLRHDPTSAEAYTGVGNAYRGLKLWGSAIAAHTESLRLKQDATTYNNRGNVYQDMMDNTRAIADYDMSIKLDPNYATAYYNRGNSRLAAGDKDGAVADYRRAAKLNPHLKQATDMLQQVDKKL